MPRIKDNTSNKQTKTIKASQTKTKIKKETFLPSLLLRIKNFSSYLTVLTKYRPTKIFYLIAVSSILLLIFGIRRDLFLAATVNGSPISNIELLSRLNDQYRQQILNQLINEKIVLDEAKKRGVIIKNSEIEEKISELEDNLGGAETLNAMLAQQGQTKITLKDNIKLQLLVEKMYQEEASVSAEEVTKFVAENQVQLEATEAGEQYKEAGEYLKQQKISEIFSIKFQELKQKANIKIF